MLYRLAAERGSGTSILYHFIGYRWCTLFTLQLRTVSLLYCLAGMITAEIERTKCVAFGYYSRLHAFFSLQIQSEQVRTDDDRQSQASQWTLLRMHRRVCNRHWLIAIAPHWPVLLATQEGNLHRKRVDFSAEAVSGFQVCSYNCMLRLWLVTNRIIYMYASAYYPTLNQWF